MRGEAQRRWQRVIHAIPTTHNRVLRAHWSQRPALCSWWREVIAAHCGICREPPERALVRITVYRQQRQDRDNAYASSKPLVDALVHAGWLRDDRLENLELEVEEHIDRKNPRTRLEWRKLDHDR